MSAQLELFRGADARLQQLVDDLDPAALKADTPCAGWDLARALGQHVSFTAGEAELAEGVAGVVVPMLRPQGLFADEVATTDGASPTQRVIALTGRSPL